MSTPIFNVFIIDNGLIIKSSKVFLTLRHTVFPDTYFMFYVHDFFLNECKLFNQHYSMVHPEICHHFFTEKYFFTEKFRFPSNESQLKNPDISGAIFTLSLSILILNSQCVEGARDVKVL